MAVLRDYVMNRQERLSYMVEQYQTTILKVCYAYLCNLEDAKDAVQETFLKAYNNLGSFRGECSEKSWLIRIARNTCLDMRRSAWYRRVDQRIQLEDLSEVHQSDAPEDEQQLTYAIMRLPSKLKDAVILYYYQDLPMKEVAEILNITQPSVSNRLSRARKKLKMHLEEER